MDAGCNTYTLETTFGDEELREFKVRKSLRAKSARKQEGRERE